MAEPKVGMSYGNYDQKVTELLNKYGNKVRYSFSTVQKKDCDNMDIFRVSVTGVDPYNNQTIFEASKTNYMGTYVYEGGLRYSGEDSDGTITHIRGFNTYAKDGANGCPKDGIVQEGEILTFENEGSQ